MGCACGKDSCGCQAPALIYLQDEVGERHAFYLADKFVVNNQQYVLAMSAEDAEQYALLKVMYNEFGQEVLTNITDEQEWAEIEANIAAQ